jgi:hypothetical protein
VERQKDPLAWLPFIGWGLIAAVVIGLALAAVASADHALSERVAKREFGEAARERLDVNRFLVGPRCRREGRYEFDCAALVRFDNGRPGCVKGTVKATGRRHHVVKVVNLRFCADYEVPT